jgi:hypothetical protein
MGKKKKLVVCDLNFFLMNAKESLQLHNVFKYRRTNLPTDENVDVPGRNHLTWSAMKMQRYQGGMSSMPYVMSAFLLFVS